MADVTLHLLGFKKLSEVRGMFYVTPQDGVPSFMKEIVERATLVDGVMEIKDDSDQVFDVVDTHEFTADYIFDKEFTKWLGWQGPAEIWAIYLQQVGGDPDAFKALWESTDVGKEVITGADII